MSEEDRIQQYLRRVRSALLVTKSERRRALEEISNHLDDGIAEHIRNGATRPEAIALVINELGPPGVVAGGFNDGASAMPDAAGAARWLPMVLPFCLTIVAVGTLAWSLTWFRDGLTRGEQIAQRSYLRSALITGALAYATYFAIQRARGDHAWRWAAWLCTGLALAILLAPRML